MRTQKSVWKDHSHISHQTGTLLMALSAQIRELMNSTRQKAPTQIMNAQVPEFHACKCHDNGTTLSTNARKANIGKSGKVGSDACMIRGGR
ncbi:hypothetical protein HHX47_DHR2000356 [Lentinula edodes]|nr:hypothetical protein HHX47_DHR2000356 [Lentinula edodes]